MAETIRSFPCVQGNVTGTLPPPGYGEFGRFTFTNTAVAPAKDPLPSLGLPGPTTPLPPSNPLYIRAPSPPPGQLTFPPAVPPPHLVIPTNPYLVPSIQQQQQQEPPSAAGLVTFQRGGVINYSPAVPVTMLYRGAHVDATGTLTGPPSPSLEVALAPSSTLAAGPAQLPHRSSAALLHRAPQPFPFAPASAPFFPSYQPSGEAPSAAESPVSQLLHRSPAAMFNSAPLMGVVDGFQQPFLSTPLPAPELQHQWKAPASAPLVAPPQHAPERTLVAPLLTPEPYRIAAYAPAPNHEQTSPGLQSPGQGLASPPTGGAASEDQNGLFTFIPNDLLALGFSASVLSVGSHLAHLPVGLYLYLVIKDLVHLYLIPTSHVCASDQQIVVCSEFLCKEVKIMKTCKVSSG